MTVKRSGRLPHGRRLSLGLAAVMLMQPALAQEAPDLEAGLAYARERCSMCHAVEPDRLVSPDQSAPAFEEMADWPEMTVNYLSVWLVTSHPTMPNLVVEPDDAGNLAAYLLSLRD